MSQCSGDHAALLELHGDKCRTRSPPIPSLPNPSPPRTRNFQAHPCMYPWYTTRPALPRNWNSAIHAKGCKNKWVSASKFKKKSSTIKNSKSMRHEFDIMNRQPKR